MIVVPVLWILDMGQPSCVRHFSRCDYYASTLSPYYMVDLGASTLCILWPFLIHFGALIFG